MTALAQDNYPKLANYYLSYFKADKYAELARWDLLVLQSDMVHYQADFFNYYRQVRPEGKVLAYTYPAMYYRQSIFYDYLGFRRRIAEKVEANDWWLRDGQGEIVASWPNMSVVNLTKPEWRQFILDYLNKIYLLNKQWDGVFFDMVDARASLYNKQGIDIDNNGRTETSTEVDALWQGAMADWLKMSRQMWPEKLIVINGNSLVDYQPNINGRMFENFPTPWEGSGKWADSMKQYLYRLPKLNQKPYAYILNGVYNSKNERSRYQQMRFGLASSLLGEGYFSFDNGETGHNETWWFDEYNVDLGQSTTEPINLDAPEAQEVLPGVWRRDFDKGMVLVNSTYQLRNIRLPDGEFKKIKGLQDPSFNTGDNVETVALCPMSGIILLRQSAPQPELDGTYLMSYDYAAARVKGDWWQEARRQVNLFTKRLSAWFNFYYYGHKN